MMILSINEFIFQSSFASAAIPFLFKDVNVALQAKIKIKFVRRQKYPIVFSSIREWSEQKITVRFGRQTKLLEMESGLKILSE